MVRFNRASFVLIIPSPPQAGEGEDENEVLFTYRVSVGNEDGDEALASSTTGSFHLRLPEQFFLCHSLKSLKLLYIRDYIP